MKFNILKSCFTRVFKSVQLISVLKENISTIQNSNFNKDFITRFMWYQMRKSKS